MLSLRKSRARLLEDASKVRFDDVGGAEDTKLELQDVIDYLRDPSAWKRAGIARLGGAASDSESAHATQTVGAGCVPRAIGGAAGRRYATVRGWKASSSGRMAPT
ncbi:MAG: hypothetical protein ACOC1F_01985 [Myxococcota bacterium]